MADNVNVTTTAGARSRQPEFRRQDADDYPVSPVTA
jgi:hypothetical protein